MGKVGKNEPCNCGSGLPYYECCFIEDVLHVGTEYAERLNQSIHSEQENRVFDSIEAAMRHTEAINQAPLDDFRGLSPSQMYRFLYYPFDSPDLVVFNLDLQRFPESPFFRLFPFLLAAVAKEHLKATVKGMLPVKLIRETAQWYYGEEKYRDRQQYMSFRTETDLPVLHTVRLVAELSGFIRKFKGRFQLTKVGEEFIEKGMNGRFFLRIFTVYTRKFNWGYNDRYPDIQVIQQSFLFTLYLLAKFGGEYRSTAFYEDSFLAAFPGELSTVPELSYSSPENTIKRCFTLRSMARFGHFLGFVEFDDTQKEKRLEQQQVRKTLFVDEWVKFLLN